MQNKLEEAIHSPKRLVELAKEGDSAGVRRESKVLADLGIDVNEIDKSTGTTALIRASMKGRTEVVEVLLEDGA